MNLRWIKRDGKLILQQLIYTDHDDFFEDVPVVEDKPKSVTITKEDLAKAWDMHKPTIVNNAEDSGWFERIAIDLGL